MSQSTGPVYRPRSGKQELVDDREAVSADRMYLAEPGWRIDVKAGSDREFCYTMKPGQDFYHRLLDGEIYLHRHAEKLCLECAARRGLLVGEPRRLRDVVIDPAPDTEEIPVDLGWYDVKNS